MTAPGWTCDGPGRWNDNIYKLSRYRRLLKKRPQPTVNIPKIIGGHKPNIHSFIMAWILKNGLNE